jgi:surfeit locus 1 family protein
MAIRYYRKSLLFEINLKVTFFSLFFLPLFLWLGFWQLQRADEKRYLEEEWQRLNLMKPVPFDQKTSSARRVYIEGEFDQEHYWLLEGQIFNGRVGYHVIMPLNTVASTVLVNRGWVASGKYREQIPIFETPQGTVTVQGLLASPTDSPLVKERYSMPEWPVKILEIDFDIQSKQYEKPLIDKILKIDDTSPGALDVLWSPINMSATKHLGYAFQWFSMALAIVVLWIFSNSNVYQLMVNRND